MCGECEMARTHAVEVGGHARHVAHVDSGRRQGANGSQSDDQPLVVDPALRFGPRADHFNHAYRWSRARN